MKTAILVDPSNANDVKCILCGKVIKSRINRHNVHIANIKGNGVKPCLRASKEHKAKCREALEENVRHLKRTHVKRKRSY